MKQASKQRCRAKAYWKCLTISSPTQRSSINVLLSPLLDKKYSGTAKNKLVKDQAKVAEHVAGYFSTIAVTARLRTFHKRISLTIPACNK